MKTPINLRSAIISQGDAEKLIAIYAGRIIRCIEAGWQRRINVQAVSPEDFSILSDRSIANNVYDWIANAVQHEFKDQEPEVRVIVKYGSVKLVLGDLLISKLHKASALGRISRNKTIVQARFDTQQVEQGVLPNFPYATNIYITWRLNAVGTEIDTISVSCPISRHEVAWESVIKKPTAVEMPAQFSTTLGQTGRTSRIIAKEEREKHAHKENATLE